MPFCKVKFVFKTSNRLKSYLSLKDIVLEPLRSCQIYNFMCGSCSSAYTGKTFRYMKVRVSEHQGVSLRTDKHLKGTFSTLVRDHMLDCNHLVAWDDFKVLGRESNHWLLEILASSLILILMCTWQWRWWPPKARKEWYVELKRYCFYFTHVILLLLFLLMLLLLLLLLLSMGA